MQLLSKLNVCTDIRAHMVCLVTGSLLGATGRVSRRIKVLFKKKITAVREETSFLYLFFLIFFLCLCVSKMGMCQERLLEQLTFNLMETEICA